MSLIIAAIDPSLVGTAVCILDADTDKIIDLVTFKLPKDSKGITRLNLLAKQLNKIMSKYSPKEIFIEGYSFMSKGRSIFNLGELGGVFRLILAKKWGGYYEIPPTSLKKFVTGKGNAKKQIMLEQTYRKYGLGSETLKDDNQVDAYGLARFGSAFVKWDQGNTNFAKYEIEALKGLKTKCKL
jgi:crossover junction endodeoxyribonuclease RuvC